MTRKYKRKKRTYVSTYEMKCQFHNCCDTCPLPACSMDGYDPTREVRRFNPPSFHWTPDKVEHYQELKPLKLSISVLANIFDCTPGTVSLFIAHHGGRS